MVFHGFQKMTMLDFPGYVACTVFTPGCNFRCPFCHNSLLVTKVNDNEVYSEDEILAYLKKRKGVIDGICISGGEPLMHDDIFDFVKKVKETGMLVKIDTNGSFPDKLKKLIDSGNIDYVAMDIKNCPEKYAVTTGIHDFDITPIRKSVELLLEGRVAYEFRTTVVKEFHTPQDMVHIGEFISGADKYFLQHFIESESNIQQGLTPLDREEMENLRISVSGFVKNAELRGI
ncbi:MAG: anaerobic ribonucleoside-triphosphate reductase activating protein [Clostridia bacterium]|nr:anaerobic ribonucleoside-triphosphate reductase activating protein [Clostridia bacterium]